MYLKKNHLPDKAIKKSRMILALLKKKIYKNSKKNKK
jgi:hypothetical protein